MTSSSTGSSRPTPGPEAPARDVTAVTAALTTLAERAAGDGTAIDPAILLDALAQLRWAQARLAEIEPVLIGAARAAGASWQSLAPALGVASRQAAERRYLRSVSTTPDEEGTTRDQRVQAERDRRAGHRAVHRWANDNTAALRQLAGQVTALTDLGDAATDSIGRLHDALGEPDASALPGLLAATQPHLPHHPELDARIGAVTERTDEIRRRSPRHPRGPR
jgi:hypothetical protein